jgi:hypothetical protein
MRTPRDRSDNSNVHAEIAVWDTRAVDILRSLAIPSIKFGLAFDVALVYLVGPFSFHFRGIPTIT